ncbi:MAG: phosphoribosyltransferase domain-containing protein [Actinobacteria bacterium]|nr:phosphoribosyltransferase domain-containing protein [Actinomycetota bacterium]
MINKDKSKGLLKIALSPRVGDKRSYYIRTNLDGRFFLGDPKIINEICQEIHFLLPKKTDKEIILGLAEGSLIIGFALARIRFSSFSCSTKTQRSDFKKSITFEEGHRNNMPSHYLYSLKRNDEVIILEDEISTGNTMINVCRELNKNKIKVKAIVSIVEILNFKGREKIKEKTGLDLISLTSIVLE